MGWEVAAIVVGGLVLNLFTAWKTVAVVRAELKANLPWIKESLKAHDGRLTYLEHRGSK